MAKFWNTVEDKNIRNIWKSECKCGQEEYPTTVEVNPSFYGESGIPICPECGDDYI